MRLESRGRWCFAVAVSLSISCAFALASAFLPHKFHLHSTLQTYHTLQLHIMADKLRAQQQLEALQARYIGIGSADTTKHEWTSNIARDSLSSYIGHPPLLQYMSIGLGQPREKTRVQLLERMVRPVGPPPEVNGRGKRICETEWLTGNRTRTERLDVCWNIQTFLAWLNCRRR